MAHIIADRVKETSTTTGTGALTLAGAESKYVAFSSVMAAGDTCYYAIVNRDAAEWEVGLGTYNTTLARTTVLASSNAGSAVNLSAGTKEVMLVLAAAGVIAAERAIILGVTQASHGFAVGNAVYHTGSAWAKAKADAVGTAEALGIVSSVPDTGTAQITMAGYISGLSGLTAGTVYFLSDSTAGALTATEPSTAGYVSKPMLVALSTTTGIVINYRGKSIPSYSSTIYAKTSGTATAGQTVITASYAVGYVDVFVNGVKLAAADITATNGTSVTLAEAMAADDVYEVIGWGTSGMTPGQLTSDLFSGDGSDTTFTLSVTPASLNQTWVFVEGVYQQKATYSISGTTLTFTTAPPSGTNNIEVITAGAMVTGTPNDGTVTGAKTASGNWNFGKNAIINGAFDIWQRGTSFASPTTSSYSADRWRIDHSTTGAFTVSRSTDVPTVAEAGVLANYSLKIDCTTAEAGVAAGEYANIYQPIEGYVWRNFAQRALTLSFWVKSPKTGTHYGFVLNSTTDRTFVFSYSVSAADTWEKKTVSITASPSAGTWDYTTGIGALVGFSLVAGGDYDNGVVGEWSSTFATAGSSPPNLLDNTANNFHLALVQLEVGPVATDFEIRPHPLELDLCRRYYQTGVGYWVFGAVGTTYAHNFQAVFSPTMRGTPTFSRTDTSQVNVGSVSAVGGDASSYWSQVTATAGGNVANYVTWTASAEL